MKLLPATELLLRLMANEPDEFKRNGKYEEMNRAMRGLVHDQRVQDVCTDTEMELRALPARDRTALISGYRTHVVNTQLTGRLLKAASGETKRERDASRVTIGQNHVSPPSTWPTSWDVNAGCAEVTVTGIQQDDSVLVNTADGEYRWASISNGSIR